jgi:hypothetical protein
MLGKQRLPIGAGVVVVGALVLSAERDSTHRDSAQRDEPPPRCEVSVTADVLNVHSGPDAGTPVIDQLGAGEVAEADGTIRNGFRQMGEGRWVSAQFLTETPGSDCD